MKIQTLIRRAERPIRIVLAGVSAAFALILLGAAWFEPARTETGIHAHPQPVVLRAVAHPHVHTFAQGKIVSSLIQVVETAI
jgi:hypothetical protein